MIDMTEFKQFSASKLSENNRFSVSVQYTDIMGNTHRIECKSRKALDEARTFLSIFKAESVKLNEILCEYPVSMGKFPKKFHKEIKADLSACGFGSISKYLLK